jgi:hypothetical protein
MSAALRPRQGWSPRFELVTRRRCHLCDEMAAQLESAGLSFSSLDVDQHPELRARFGEVVPVLLRDGRPVAKVRISAGRLRRLVRRRR